VCVRPLTPMDMLHSERGLNDRYTKLKLLAIRMQDSETKSLGGTPVMDLHGNWRTDQRSASL
jgi:hypothetical protein